MTNFALLIRHGGGNENSTHSAESMAKPLCQTAGKTLFRRWQARVDMDNCYCQPGITLRLNLFSWELNRYLTPSLTWFPSVPCEASLARCSRNVWVFRPSDEAGFWYQNTRFSGQLLAVTFDKWRVVDGLLLDIITFTSLFSSLRKLLLIFCRDVVCCCLREGANFIRKFSLLATSKEDLALEVAFFAITYRNNIVLF